MSKLAITRPTGVVKLSRDQAAFKEWDTKTAALAAMAVNPVMDAREAGDPRSELAAEIRDLERRMEQSTVVFEIQALQRKRFAELELEHPVREGVASDEQWGVDLSTFVDAVMCEPGTILSVTENGERVDFGPEDWPDLADDMANGQWEQFAVKVFEVNRGRVAAPKSQLASLVMRSSAAS